MCSVCNEIEKLMVQKEIMWAQKAWSNWIIQGDRNARYFQTVIKQRRARNRIIHLKGVDGSCMEDLVEVEHHLVENFKKQYHESDARNVQSLMKDLESLSIPKLDQNQQHQLNKPIIDAKIERVVHQLTLKRFQDLMEFQPSSTRTFGAWLGRTS